MEMAATHICMHEPLHTTDAAAIILRSATSLFAPQQGFAGLLFFLRFDKRRSPRML